MRNVRVDGGACHICFLNFLSVLVCESVGSCCIRPRRLWTWCFCRKTRYAYEHERIYYSVFGFCAAKCLGVVDCLANRIWSQTARARIYLYAQVFELNRLANKAHPTWNEPLRPRSVRRPPGRGRARLAYRSTPDRHAHRPTP